jgi:hypothetical protein
LPPGDKDLNCLIHRDEITVGRAENGLIVVLGEEICQASEHHQQPGKSPAEGTDDYRADGGEKAGADERVIEHFQTAALDWFRIHKHLIIYLLAQYNADWPTRKPRDKPSLPRQSHHLVAREKIQFRDSLLVPVQYRLLGGRLPAGSLIAGWSGNGGLGSVLRRHLGGLRFAFRSQLGLGRKPVFHSLALRTTFLLINAQREGGNFIVGGFLVGFLVLSHNQPFFIADGCEQPRPPHNFQLMPLPDISNDNLSTIFETLAAGIVQSC